MPRRQAEGRQCAPDDCHGLEWSPPLIKALATALIVVCASAFAEVLGPFWGALIITLPVSAGPAYVFLAVRNGVDFVAASALSSVAANAATGLFLITYGLLGRDNAAMARSLPRGRRVAGRRAGDAAGGLDRLDGDAVEPRGIRAWDHAVEDAPDMPAPGLPGPAEAWFDLPVRAAGVAAFVSVVVAVSEMLGPAATGIMAVFPISLISLIVIVRPRMGAQAAVAAGGQCVAVDAGVWLRAAGSASGDPAMGNRAGTGDRAGGIGAVVAGLADTEDTRRTSSPNDPRASESHEFLRGSRLKRSVRKHPVREPRRHDPELR